MSATNILMLDVLNIDRALYMSFGMVIKKIHRISDSPLVCIAFVTWLRIEKESLFDGLIYGGEYDVVLGVMNTNMLHK